MQSLRIIEMLRTLSAIERRAFGEFLASPYFSASERSYRFWTHIQQYAPAFDSPNLAREVLFAELYPNTPLDQQKFREEVSLLYRLLKQFLAIEMIIKTPHVSHVFMLRAVRERRLESTFEFEANVLEREIATIAQPSEGDYWAAYQLADERNRMFGQQQVRVANDSLQQKADALDTYYWLVKLRESCEMLNRSQLFNATFETHLTLTEPLHTTPHAGIAISAQRTVALYEAIYAMLQQPTVSQHFRTVIEIITEVKDTLTPQELRAVYQFAQNHCIRRINAGETAYTRELVEIYRQLLESGVLLLETGHLPHTDYKNAVTAALRNKDIAFAEHIIATYRPLLAPKQAENAHSFCVASLLFETGKNREAIKLLQSVQPSDVFYYLSARDLLLKIYYETNEYETLRYLLDAYLVYLRRNTTLSKSQKESRFNFIKFTKQLTRIADSNPVTTQKQRAKLLEALSTTPNTTNLIWLQEKLNGQ